jgi:hypothetical protein
MAIAAGKSGAYVLFERLEVHHKPSNCIGTLSGKLLQSDLHHCSQNALYWGFSAGALKTIYEAEIARSFVHDNEAVGLWYEQSCRNTPDRTNGFWANHNLIVNNGRSGISYRFSPIPNSPSESSALVEDNRLAGNKWGGADMNDAQNGTFRGNVFGPQIVAGTAYRHNGSDVQALEFSDSERAARNDLRNGAAIDNQMNGETIGGCDKPDSIVACSGNR